MNLGRLRQRIYSPPPLTTRALPREPWNRSPKPWRFQPGLRLGDEPLDEPALRVGDQGGQELRKEAAGAVKGMTAPA